MFSYVFYVIKMYHIQNPNVFLRVEYNFLTFLLFIAPIHIALLFVFWIVFDTKYSIFFYCCEIYCCLMLEILGSKQYLNI